MKFKKGTKVEVLSETEVSYGSWRCAEIVRGNGRGYYVRYDGCDDKCSEEIVERVSRKDIRPCPPVLDVTEDWRPGELAEVCQNYSWLMATVLKDLCKGYILVRLLGSPLEVHVNKFEIRVRQYWSGGKWINIGKGPSRCETGKCEGKEKNFLNSYLDSKTMKRSRHSQIELSAEPPLKLRATDNEDRYRSARVAYSSMLFKPWDVQIEGYRENFATNDADEVSSSVGSCSIGDYNLEGDSYHVSKDLKCETSDGESAHYFRCEEGNHSVTSKEEMAAEIHLLELHAYRCTVEALHASGPLGWEVEGLLTNLRLSLHISSDEHLMEIRNLISSKNSIHVK